jgi:hypothetical protein
MDMPLIITRLRNFYNANKRLPTYGEMCKLLGYRSKGAVRYVVKKLIAEGILEKEIVPANRCGYIKIRALFTYEVPLCVALKSMTN